MLRGTLTHVSSRRLETNALPSLALTSQGGISGHAARVVCGELELEQESESDVVQAHTNKVKLCTFADQTSDQEVTELTEDLEAYDMFLRSVELCELEDFETSWKAYRAGCIILDQVPVATLDAQVEWAIQHQADVRAGLELLERLCRKALLRSGAATFGAPERIVRGGEGHSQKAT